MQMGFYFNADLCIGCKACVMACKDLHDSPLGISFRRVYQVVWGKWIGEGNVRTPVGVGSYSLSLACAHCERPACLTACPKGAIQKRDTGAVWIDYSRCVACRICIRACPYGAIDFNRRAHRPEKCDFCWEQQEKGEAPACAASCPMRCLSVRPLPELIRLAETDPYVSRMEDEGTSPAVFIRQSRNRPPDGEAGTIRSMKEER